MVRVCANTVAYTLRVRSSEYKGDASMVQELVRRALQPSDMDES